MFQALGRTITTLSQGGLSAGLGGRNAIPDGLLIRPADPWPGCTEAGHRITQGCFSYGGNQFVMRGKSWETPCNSHEWLNYVHGFSWLRDLRSCGGEVARYAGAAYIKNWIQFNRDKKSEGWNAGRMGERLSMWIAHHDYFGGYDESFEDVFYPSLAVQARTLLRSIVQAEGLDKLRAAKGLLYAGLAMAGHENLIEKALDVLVQETRQQILDDGGHITRSPQNLLVALQIYLDVRRALIAGAYPVPERIQAAIDMMAPALRFFVYGDKYFGVFNGGGEGTPELIEMVLAQAGLRGKTMSSLPVSGYERVSQGRTLLLMDTGRTPPFPHDRGAHAAPLSFEMAYGKERILVSCGTHPTSEDWAQSLRLTAAHTALCLDARNACEIRENGHFGRKVSQSDVRRDENRKATLIEAAHDGYLSTSGITHRRRLFLCEQGTDFRGEDTLEAVTQPAREMEVAIRFHLHPRVIVSLVREGDEALLRLPSGVGWRFCHTGGTLALENSVYLGADHQPRKTKQLVIYSTIEREYLQIKWALQREGI